MESSHHTIAYVELVAPDLPASRAFYEAAFGWQFNDYGPTYAGIRDPAGHRGHRRRLQGGADERDVAQAVLAGLVVTRAAVDLDGSVAAVEAAGGVLVTPPEAYPGGRRFTFTDPAGNVLGVFQPDAPSA